MWLLLLAAQAVPPDEAIGALVECQFAVSRSESARRGSVEEFERTVERVCAAAEQDFLRRAAAFFVARGRSAAEARAEAERILAEERASMRASYARILELTR